MIIDHIETYTTNRGGYVRVTTDDGAEGWGQMAPYQARISAEVLHSMIAGIYLGQPVEGFEHLADYALMKQNKYTGSFPCRAVAGIDTALWDLKGKLEGKHVTALFKEQRTEFPVYGSSMRRDISPEEEADRMVALRDKHGIRGFKCRLATANNFGMNEDPVPGRSEALIPLLREKLGEECFLMADANSGYSVEEAIRIGKILEEYKYDYFEEPVSWWDIEETAEVNAALDIPVCGGEQDFQINQWQRILSQDAVHTIQPDVCYIGGFSRALKVAAMAAEYGKPCMPHSANKTMITWFSASLLAVIPNPGPYCELSIEEKPEFTEQIDIPPVGKDGKLMLPTGPGWGVKINPDWLKTADCKSSSL